MLLQYGSGQVEPHTGTLYATGLGVTSPIITAEHQLLLFRRDTDALVGHTYPVMVDGTGMCGGCRLTVDGKTKYACVDGPEFDGHKVDFAEAMNRSGFYREHEGKCKLRG